METEMPSNNGIIPYSGINMLLNDGGLKGTTEQEEIEEEEAEIRLRGDEGNPDSMQRSSYAQGKFAISSYALSSVSHIAADVFFLFCTTF